MPRADKDSIPHPQIVIWLLTAKCNLKCSHCYTSRFPGGKELDEGQALRVVQSAAKARVRHIGFSGGEVFLRNDALRIIEQASKLGMSTSVVTNGTLVNEEIAEKLADLGTITFLSIDGARKETHERIRGRASWDAAIRAAENLSKFKVNFSTIMAVNKVNHTEALPYLSLARELGARAACFIPTMPAGRATMELILEPKDIVRLLHDIAEWADRERFPISLWCTPFAKLVLKSREVFTGCCRSSADEMDIDPQGNVLLCDVIDVIVSNVKEKGVLEAWQEQEENPLVKELTNPRLSPPCLDCPLSQECRGGCFARAQLMAGDIYAPDPLCPRVAGLL